MEKKHIYYYDYLRLIAAFSVIYMHTAASPLRSGIDTGWHGINILTSFGFTAVPLFIMMSGQLVLSNERTADVTYLLKKRLPHLVIPLVGWSVVAILWRGILDKNLSGQVILQGVVNALHEPAWVHFWYMYTLIALYVIAPFLYGMLNTLDKKGHIFLFLLCCLISVRRILQVILPLPWADLVNIDLINQLSIFGGAVAVFLLGYYLGNSERKVPNLLLWAIFLITLIVIVLGTWLRSRQNGYYDAAFQSQMAGFEVLLAACLFLLFKQNCNRQGKLFEIIPVIPLSLPIYMMHCISLSMIEGKFTVVTFWDTIWVTALNFVLCFVTMKTVATIKPLCYLATGMSYKDACRTCNWIYTFQKLKKIR